MAEINAVELAIDGGWQAIEEVRFEHMWDAKEVCDQDIRLDIIAEPGFQTMSGLGGAFGEIGYQALSTLPAAIALLHLAPVIRCLYRHGNGGTGGHAWNELHLDDGAVFIFDVMNSASKYYGIRQPKASQYLDCAG